MAQRQLEVLDGWTNVEEYAPDGTLLGSFVPGLGDTMLQVRRGGVTSWLLSDDQATVRALADATGAVVERVAYEDYGWPTVSWPAGGSGLESAFGNPFLFTGRPWDADTGLYDFRTRLLEALSSRRPIRGPPAPRCACSTCRGRRRDVTRRRRAR